MSKRNPPKETGVSSSENIPPCSICGWNRSSAIPLVVTDGNAVILCRHCGIYQTHPFPKNTADFYQEDYYARQSSRRFVAILEWGIRWFRWERTWNLNRRYERGRILDVGCGRGLMMYFLKNRFGWDVRGTQLSRTAHEYATSTLKVPVFLGDLLDMPAEKPFTVVTMFHVLEHVLDPAGYLAEIHRRLTDGGALLIEVPNTASVMATLTKARWFGWDLPYHTFHFNAKSLTALLQGNGFRVEEVKHWSGEFNTFFVLQSFLNLLFDEKDYLFHLLQRKSRIADRPLAALTCLFIGAVMAPLALIVAALGALGSKGEVIRVFARKT